MTTEKKSITAKNQQNSKKDDSNISYTGGIDLSEIEKIVKIVQNSDLSEFELEQKGAKIKLSRHSRFVQVEGKPEVQNYARTDIEAAIINTNSSALHKVEPLTVNLEDQNLRKVESPIVGTFYKKPSPDAESFVNVGDTVRKGQTLCIIEAMKLMNEISSPCAGKIEKILLNDGQVAEFGEVLFLIKE